MGSQKKYLEHSGISASFVTSFNNILTLVEFFTSCWLFHKRLLCLTRDCPVSHGINKGLPCPLRDYCIPQRTTLYHKVLSCPLRDCSVPQVIGLLTKYFSVLQGFGLSHMGLLCFTRDCSIPHGHVICVFHNTPLYYK